MPCFVSHHIHRVKPRSACVLVIGVDKKQAIEDEPADSAPARYLLPFVAVAGKWEVHVGWTLPCVWLGENNLLGSANRSTINPMVDDLHSLKDDMNAFILGHGMQRFRAYVSEEMPSVMWEGGSNPDSWKDFVELAKASGIAFLTVNDESLEKDDLDFLIERIQNSSNMSDDDMDEAKCLRAYVGKCGFIQLGFSYHGMMYLHEVATEWFERYQQLLDTADDCGRLLSDQEA